MRHFVKLIHVAISRKILTTYVSSDLEFVVVDLAGESLLLAKSAQPSSVVGFAAQNGASKGVSVEAAKGLESHGLPVSMAVASVEPDSITSSRWLNSAQARQKNNKKFRKKVGFILE